MSTFNENLQQTVSDTLTSLSNQQAETESIKATAEYTLYYAQGAEITARDKLSKTEEQKKFYQQVNEQGVVNDNQAINLLATQTAAQTTVAASVTNMATAASNVQIASNSVALVASDIGAALNIASASLYGTDTYNRISEVNQYINEVANASKTASLASMEASGMTSEIITAQVQAEATTVKSKIENLLSVTKAEFDQLSTQATSENATVGTTSKAERVAEGTLYDVHREAQAIDQSYSNANARLNQNLSVSVTSGTSLELNFTGWPDKPFGTPGPASIPPTDPKYFVMFVQANKKSLLDTSQAAQLFAQSDVTESAAPVANQDVTLGNGFTPVNKGKTQLKISSASQDIYGVPLSAGTEYVVFIYAELSLKYKQYLANFSDILSSPSQSFIPATNLPLASDVNYTEGDLATPANYYGKLTFTATVPADIKDSVAFRCIFIDDSLENQALNFLNGNPKTQTPPVFFDKQIALQTPSANYVTAVSDTTSGSFTANLGEDLTDNFGDPIIAGHSYKPMILTLVEGSTQGSAPYVAQLSAAAGSCVLSVVDQPKTPEPVAGAADPTSIDSSNIQKLAPSTTYYQEALASNSAVKTKAKTKVKKPTPPEANPDSSEDSKKNAE